MKRNKRIIGIVVMLSLIMGTSNIAYAAGNLEANSNEKTGATKVFAYIRPDFTVQLNDSVQIFKNAKGIRVFPLVYGGNTYLPLRSISAIMKEDIEWDSYSKTIYIGKTLSNPNKSKVRKDSSLIESVESVSQYNYVKPKEKIDVVSIDLRPDVTIMYDFQIQNFMDAKGTKMHPIMYKGSTYLPISAISALMKEKVEWDEDTKTIKIGNEEKNEQEEVTQVTPITKRLSKEFQNAVETYDQATEKVTGIYKCTDSAILAMMASSVTEDVRAAEKQSNSLRSMKVSKMTDEERDAYTALCDFVDISQYYLLVLENIAYLAASGEDYSMLSETFLNFAMSSQQMMNTARNKIMVLPQL